MDACGLKKDNEEFNIAMGAYNLADACEIVRIFSNMMIKISI